MRLEPKQSVLQVIPTVLARLLKRETRPYHVLDPHIAPLVHKMNSHGDIRTVASCQGHFFGSRPPYVYFKAPIGLVQQIEAALRDAHSNQALNFFWALKGIFDENCQLTFLLYSPELDTSVFTALLPPLELSYGRSAINQDFQTIGELISANQWTAAGEELL